MKGLVLFFFFAFLLFNTYDYCGISVFYRLVSELRGFSIPVGYVYLERATICLASVCNGTIQASFI